MGAQVGNGGGGGRSSGLSGSATAMLMARRHAGSNGAMSDINVTPFVDVVLVLLIIFMITAPLLTRAMDVSLPSASLRQESTSERTVVSIDAQGRTFVNEEAVNVQLLEDQMRRRVEVSGLRLVYVRADETLQYRQIIQVMDILKRAGVDTVGLVYVYPEEKLE